MIKYYTKEYGDFEDAFEYVESDIGWRWCKDELPEKERVYLVLHETGMDIALYAKDGSWYIKPTGDYRPAPCFSIVQWCKLPEPLKEEADR